MRHRAVAALAGLGVAVIGFMSSELVRSAEDGPNLGEPIVVLPPAESSRSARSSEPHMSPHPGGTGRSGAPEDDGGGAPERSASGRPVHKSKAEPVKPSPRPGGDDDNVGIDVGDELGDDDDDDGEDLGDDDDN